MLRLVKRLLLPRPRPKAGARARVQQLSAVTRSRRKAKHGWGVDMLRSSGEMVEKLECMACCYTLDWAVRACGTISTWHTLGHRWRRIAATFAL